MFIDHLCKTFDLDVDFDWIGENAVKELFKRDGKVEVRTENDTWKEEECIKIELRYNGSPAGLAYTKAKTWIHVLMLDGMVVGGYIFPVDKFKEAIKKLYKEEKATMVLGGKNNAYQLIKIPLSELWRVF